MSPELPESPSRDEMLLSAADEALRLRPAGDVASTLPVPGEEFSSQLRESMECLTRLERRWPRGGAPQKDPLIPQRIGRFDVQGVLGRGGFGVVLLAHDPHLRRPIALKLPRLEILFTREQRQRFIQEARATAQLEHPNIVPVYEAGDLNGVLYIASAYCPEGDLAAWLRRMGRPADVRTSARIVATLAAAVEHANSRGIIHRDLKPSNVLLVAQESERRESADDFPYVPRIADFGLAKVLESQLAVTGSSVLLGTPQYMSPEQADGRSTDSTTQTDVYGLGAILYELLTGQAPFAGPNLVQVLDELRTQEPAPPSAVNPAVAHDLEVICLKCLHKRPDQRYARAAELAADLNRYLQGEPIAARRLTFRERIANWSRKRERMRDAGAMTMIAAVVAGTWDILLTSIMLAGPRSAEYLASGLFLQGFLSMFVYYFPLIWLGRKVMRGRRWAMWGAITIGGSLVGVTIIELRSPETMSPPGTEGVIGSNLPLTIFLFVLFSGVVLANTVALWAHRSCRSQT